MSKCAHHPETDAVGYCRQCGKGLCSACRRDVRGVIYCEDCLATLTAGSSPAPGAPNPGAALFLGIIPAVGALYNGEYTKALIHFFIFAGLISALASDPPDGVATLLGLILAGFIIYMPIEAYQTAQRRAAGLAPTPGRWQALGLGNAGKATPIGPLILIVVGVLILFGNLGMFYWARHLWRFWPLVLIALGAWMLWKRTAGPPQ